MIDKDQMVERLLSDESFQAWLAGRASGEEDRKWTLWLDEEITHRQIYEEVREVWRLAQFKAAPSQDTSHELSLLRQRLRQETASAAAAGSPLRKMPRRNAFSPLWRGVVVAAAAIIALLVLYKSGLLPGKITREPQTLFYATQFGEQIQINLPDRSRIILNANSSVEYPKDWTAGTPRQVTLHGEAYFDITAKPAGPQESFAVITNDGLIRVLGTRFVVHERGQGTKVVLEEGSVEVVSRKNESGQDLLSGTRLIPGSLLVFHRGDRSFHPQPVILEPYISWWKESYILKDTPLAEVIQRLQETYGIEVELAEAQLAERHLTGAIENGELDVILRSLSNALQVSVYKEDNKVFFGGSPQ